jgi:hypothetical protein
MPDNLSIRHSRNPTMSDKHFRRTVRVLHVRSSTCPGNASDNPTNPTIGQTIPTVPTNSPTTQQPYQIARIHYIYSSSSSSDRISIDTREAFVSCETTWCVIREARTPRRHITRHHVNSRRQIQMPISHDGTRGEAWEEFEDRFLNIATATNNCGWSLAGCLMRVDEGSAGGPTIAPP